MSSLESKQDKEDDKEQELLSDVSSRIKFRVRYAEAYTKITAIPLLQGKWKTKHGDVQVEIIGHQFTATGRYEQPQIGLASIIYARHTLGSIAKPKSDVNTIIINYKGVIINSVIDYQLSITTKPSGEPDKSTRTNLLLGVLPDSEPIAQYSGQMVVSKDFKKIEVMESDNKGNISFYDMTPLEDA